LEQEQVVTVTINSNNSAPLQLGEGEYTAQWFHYLAVAKLLDIEV
jgi:hypothetical protein